MKPNNLFFFFSYLLGIYVKVIRIWECGCCRRSDTYISCADGFVEADCVQMSSGERSFSQVQEE
uniref:Uncharacterized protein n=1 Tax=Cannabis sativa TaxID=3483 RepID=A0A803R3Z6_CANSA